MESLFYQNCVGGSSFIAPRRFSFHLLAGHVTTYSAFLAPQGVEPAKPYPSTR